MNIIYHNTGAIVIAELSDNNFIISSGQDVLELMGENGFGNCSSAIIQEKNLHPDFFRLHTGVAGEVLQKCSNYRFRLAVIGDFTKYKSKNLQDFIRESNKGNRVYFLDNINEALKKMVQE